MTYSQGDVVSRRVSQVLYLRSLGPVGGYIPFYAVVVSYAVPATFSGRWAVPAVSGKTVACF